MATIKSNINFIVIKYRVARIRNAKKITATIF